MKVNTELPIHNDENIKRRIERQMESAKLIKQKKASAYQKTIFFLDILICLNILLPMIEILIMKMNLLIIFLMMLMKIP